jgi:hypothetical protein
MNSEENAWQGFDMDAFWELEAECRNEQEEATHEHIAEGGGLSGLQPEAPSANAAEGEEGGEENNPAQPRDSVLYSGINFDEMVESIQTGSYMSRRQNEKERSRKRRRSSRASSESSSVMRINQGGRGGDDSSEIPSMISRRRKRCRTSDKTKDKEEEEMLQLLIQSESVPSKTVLDVGILTMIDIE